MPIPQESGQEGFVGSTLPDDWQYDPSWIYYWNPDNPEEIDRNSSVEISVIGGFPPYTWQVSGNGFSLSLNETEVPSNALYANETACGAATITVTDNYGVPVTGYVRCTTGGWCCCGGWTSGGNYHGCGPGEVVVISGKMKYEYTCDTSIGQSSGEWSYDCENCGDASITYTFNVSQCGEGCKIRQCGFYCWK